MAASWPIGLEPVDEMDGGEEVGWHRVRSDDDRAALGAQFSNLTPGPEIGVQFTIGAELETMRIKVRTLTEIAVPNAQKRLAFPSKESVSV